MTLRALLTLVLALSASSAQALVLCLGTDPRFSLVIDGDQVNFDYVGDGTFALSTPLPPSFVARHESGIETAGGRLPFVIAVRSCEVYGVTQPLSIDLAIPSNGATVTFSGCCRDRRS